MPQIELQKSVLLVKPSRKCSIILLKERPQAIWKAIFRQVEWISQPPLHPRNLTDFSRNTEVGEVHTSLGQKSVLFTHVYVWQTLGAQ